MLSIGCSDGAIRRLCEQGRHSPAPFLVDVQSEFLAGLSTTVVVPLIRANSHPGASATTPDPAFRVPGDSLRVLSAFHSSSSQASDGRASRIVAC
ncbi:CcdB family protein (plasmid) [Cupriavidus sp. KK10]|nr:CcdB family protein [Cupriavidus sp. KK10]